VVATAKAAGTISKELRPPPASLSPITAENIVRAPVKVLRIKHRAIHADAAAGAGSDIEDLGGDGVVGAIGGGYGELDGVGAGVSEGNRYGGGIRAGSDIDAGGGRDGPGAAGEGLPPQVGYICERDGGGRT